MIKQQILDNAPEGATHVDYSGFYLKAAKSGFMETDLGGGWDYDCDNHSDVRSLSDIKRIAELENHWVSVDDAMPSLEMRARESIVLCSTPSGTFVAWLSRNTMSFLDETRGMELPFKVTHWMPLPKPITDN